MKLISNISLAGMIIIGSFILLFERFFPKNLEKFLSYPLLVFGVFVFVSAFISKKVKNNE
jgi:ABC-type uncharacterized transport system permease subunit